MPELDIPLQLSPVFKPKIWGRRDLRPFFSRRLIPKEPKSAPRTSSLLSDQLIGEVWITDDAARFLNGPVAGQTLAEAVKIYGSQLCGSHWSESHFPVLAKYIFTSDWLSVQVHPDDDYARAHEFGRPGKCEMWYILHADGEARVLLGLKPATSRERFKKACEKGRSSDLLLRFRPKAREAVFVPPGTVHSLGPGLVLFEVEQNSDLTYRLDDHGRLGMDGKPRPLHLQKGLEVIRPSLHGHRNLPRIELREPYGSRRFVLACSYFALEELTLKRLAGFQGCPERAEVISVVEGEGRVETASGWMGTRAGDAWLIPPAAFNYRWVPREKIRLLKFYRPDLERDFLQPLRSRRVSRAKIARIVFN
jgi:mannose-6-phosphate isomerase